MRTLRPTPVEECVQVGRRRSIGPLGGFSNGGAKIDPVLCPEPYCVLWASACGTRVQSHQGRTQDLTRQRTSPSGLARKRVCTPDDSFVEVLHGEFDPGSGRTLAACLTHASGATNRLRAGQSRERVSNTWVTCPDDWDNPRKLGLIPNVPSDHKVAGERKLRPPHQDGPAAH